MDRETQEAIRQEMHRGLLFEPRREDVMADEWNNGAVEAACRRGCIVEPDGYCQHGRPSWMLVWGVI